MFGSTISHQHRQDHEAELVKPLAKNLARKVDDIIQGEGNNYGPIMGYDYGNVSHQPIQVDNHQQKATISEYHRE